MTEPANELFPRFTIYKQIRRSKFARFSIVPILLLCLSGCQSINATRQTTPDVYQAVSNAAEEQIRRIDQLLNEAEIALLRQRLTTPVDDNAYLRYLQVLAMDPSNAEAEAGISRIVEVYLSWASEAIDREDFSRATNMLNKANSVDEDNQSIVAIRQRMDAIRQQEKLFLEVNRAELSQKSSELQKKLADVAKIAESRNAVARIHAPTDAQARWIYQQMNLATERRIRATIQSGMAPGVQLNFP